MRIHILPWRFMLRAIATRAASICFVSIQQRSSAIKPYSPNATVLAARRQARAAAAVHLAKLHSCWLHCHNKMHPVEPVRVGALVTTQRKTALVRALFGEFCNAVAHPDTPKRWSIARPPSASTTRARSTTAPELAKFVYGASGCQTVEVTAAASPATLVMGPAADAAPHLAADLAAATGLRRAMSGSGQQRSTRAARTSPPSG